jgi:hypothetical protein
MKRFNYDILYLIEYIKNEIYAAIIVINENSWIYALLYFYTFSIILNLISTFNGNWYNDGSNLF